MNKELLQKNLEMKVGKDLKYIVNKLQEFLSDGVIDANESHQLSLLISQLEV